MREKELGAILTILMWQLYFFSAKNFAIIYAFICKQHFNVVIGKSTDHFNYFSYHFEIYYIAYTDHIFCMKNINLQSNTCSKKY